MNPFSHGHTEEECNGAALTARFIGPSYPVVKAVYDNLTMLTDLANGIAINVTWSSVTDKPETFLPAIHTHTIAEIDGLETALSQLSNIEVSWDEIQNKPVDFTPSVHNHTVVEIDGLQAALDNLQPAGSYVTTAAFIWDNLGQKPATFTPAAHDHDTRYYTKTEIDGMALGGGGGATTLDGLNDVDTSTTPPQNGQKLTYDEAAGKWVPDGEPVGVPLVRRHWRLWALSNGPDSWTGSREITLLDPDGNSISVAGATLTTSGNNASYAFDSNTATIWAQGVTTGAWIAVDFGAGNEKAVAGVSIMASNNLNQSIETFRLDYGDDGVAWSPLFSMLEPQSGWVSMESRTFMDPGLTGQLTVDDIYGLSSALDAKELTITAGTTTQYYRGDKSWQTLNKGAVGLGNVDNTSDANKPVSTATQTALNGKISSSEKGAASGVAPLGSDSKIATTYLPDAILGAMRYQGTWDASANNPVIPIAASGNRGYYYVVSVAGTTVIDGESDWQIGDWIVSSGTSWGKIDNSDKVSSVAGLSGAISVADLMAALAPRVQAVVSAATVTPTFVDDQVNITAQAAALALANPTGAAVDGKGIAIRIKDNGTARAISYGVQYRAIGVTLPTTTVANKTLYLGMVYNAADTKWDVVAVAQEA